ncbi:unnamed protein product [Phytophthora fragariaefolia]|uniref:Unnamed protein product n=1 Tax=Phytophthora fragariaefolia TaxID=1490495 RepID=A0A9W6XWU4_9STRA|nr:unnamed protein product [Phytophthora fragariaefolia]
MKEQREVAARATVSTPSTPRVESLKLHVNSYVGREGEPLLRWLVKVDTAITARRIVDPLSKVAFAMSCLGGRARGWASRAEFLDLQQGKHVVHAYAQRAWYLVSNIVTNPIDEATKVVTFMNGLRDGPVKTYLFREYPNTLEAAITLAMQEEFSLRQDKLHVNAPRPMPRPMVKPSGGPEPMDLSSATAAASQQRRGSRNVRCFRCGNNGHYVREAQRLCTRPRADVTKPGIATGKQKSQTKTKIVDELIVLDLDDKFDMALGIPWLARHDPVIDWAKRTIVRFRSSVATEIGGPVGAPHAPHGACDPPAEAARGAAASDLSARILTTERVVREKC